MSKAARPTEVARPSDGPVGDRASRGPASLGRPFVVPALAAVAVGLVAAAVAAIVVAPFGPATIDPDAAASVLYFERISAGARLEAFVPTTPKPLLTLVYGLTWALAHDWRFLTWETIAVFAAAAGMAVRWAFRVGGLLVDGGSAGRLAGGVAAAFLGAGLVASSDVALEVSRANSLVWALAAWLVAGLAVTGARRRPGLAGLALLAGGLVRFETLGIVGVAGAVLLLRAAVARLGRGPAPQRGDWLLLLGALAVPVACLHDLALTGDPLFWSGVPARYTALYVPSAGPVPPLEFAGTIAGRLGAEWGLVALAAVGLISLARRRAWPAALGPAALGAGVVALLFVLAARGTYISTRYYEPLDLALLALAAFGTAALAGRALARLGWVEGRRVGQAGRWSDGSTVGRVAWALGPFGAGALAVVLAWPAAPFDRSVATSLALVRAASANLAEYGGRLGELAGGARQPPPGGPDGAAIGAPAADPGRVALFVPSLLRPRIAVETGVPLTALGDTLATFRAVPPWAGLHAGQSIYHDRAADRPDALDRALEADPARLGVAVARATLVDQPAGVRILIVDSP